jgi:hypothetical protein
VYIKFDGFEVFSLVDECLLNRIAISLNGIELVFKLQPKECKYMIYYSTVNLLMKHSSFTVQIVIFQSYSCRVAAHS